MTSGFYIPLLTHPLPQWVTGALVPNPKHLLF